MLGIMLLYCHRLGVQQRPKLRIGADVDVFMNGAKLRMLKRGILSETGIINLIAVLGLALP